MTLNTQLASKLIGNRNCHDYIMSPSETSKLLLHIADVFNVVYYFFLGEDDTTDTQVGNITNEK